MGTAVDVDFEPQGFEHRSAERIQPDMVEDFFGKSTTALTFSAKVVLS